MNYIELSFSVKPKEIGSDVLIAQLAEIEFESFINTEEGFCAYIPHSKFNEKSLSKVLLINQKKIHFNFSKKIIPQQNWNAEWESNFQPIVIDDICIIHAPFHSIKKKYTYTIIIEPKMSFGTGHHDTTQLMLKKLMQLDLKNKTVLDMGCGTGVLAITASMMGASTITAIDSDDWSVENAIENTEKNCTKNVIVHKGNAELLRELNFHTILANINKNVLLSDMSTYANSLQSGGNLILSGFFETDVTDLVCQASNNSLELKDKMISNQWALLHFVK